MERTDFERLALEQLDALHRAAFQLCRDHALTADLVQDTYVRALRSAHTFEDRGGGIRPWLFTILHNVFYSRLKRDAREPASVDTIYAADDRTPLPDDAPPAWDLSAFDWDHVDERLKKAIDELDSEARLTLLLWGVEGLKYREIAAILGVPDGTVMSRLYRARQQLIARIGEFSADLGVRDRTQTNDEPS